MRYTKSDADPEKAGRGVGTCERGVRLAVDSGAGWFKDLRVCASGPDRGKDTPKKIRCTRGDGGLVTGNANMRGIVGIIALLQLGRWC